MRSVLLLLLLIDVANFAPIEEQSNTDNVDDYDLRVKRAREVMMFGNQQNESKDKEKRTSPLVHESTDHRGLILAKETVNLDFNVSHENEESIYSVDEKKVDSDKGDNEEETGTYLKAEEDVSVDGSNDENISKPQNTELTAQQNDKLGKENDYHSYINDLEDEMYLSQYLDMLKEPYDDPQYRSAYNYNIFPAKSYRYRRSNVRTNQINTANIRNLKRARRIKRDLIYPGLSFFSHDDSGYMNIPNYKFLEADDNELNYLLDAIEHAKTERADADYDDKYSLAPFKDVGNYHDNSQPTYYVPKRQAELTFVPGIKRSRDFYPYFREPEAHFSAFVPQKRTNVVYGDAYQQLMKWAAALRRDGTLS